MIYPVGGREMSESRIVSDFSTHRLDGEPVPDDVKILLAHRDEFAERTGIELNETSGWAPWLDTSYLSDADRANPDIAANVRAIAEVIGLIAFIAAYEDGQYFGYWRGPDRRAVAASPLVYLDNEGQFSFCGGSNFAEAVLGEVCGEEEEFAEMRDWMRSLGVTIRADTIEDLKYPDESVSPEELLRDLYYRYLGEGEEDSP
jgi:hypothetical protein